MSARPRNHATARPRPRVRAGRIASLALLGALGCGLHLHHPRDAATAESADGELKASRLVDGFAEELAQSRAMLAEELAAAQAWAEVGRDRDLLDVLAARGESDPEVEALYFPRCQKRFRGDGWTTLCSKISSRLQALTGHTVPFEGASSPLPAAAKPRPASGPDPAAGLLRELRTLQHHWKGPDSRESQLARAVSEYEVAARALRLSDVAAPPARCPLLDPPGRSPVLQGSIDLQRGLCRARRDNLRAVLDRGVCRGPDCVTGELQTQATQVLAVHDALAGHHEELARRLFAYASAKHPCTRPEPPTRGRPKLSPKPGSPGAPTPPASVPPARPNLPPNTGSPGQPDLPREPGPSDRPPPAPDPRPASVASLPAPFTMSYGAGLIGQPWTLLAAPAAGGSAPPLLPSTRAPSTGGGASGALPGSRVPEGSPTIPATRVPESPGTPTIPATRVPTDPASPTLPGARVPTDGAAPRPDPGPLPGTRDPTRPDPASPKLPAPATPDPARPGAPSTRVPTGDPATPGFTPVPVDLALPTCDEAVLQHRFRALGEIPVPPALAAHDLVPLARLGRLHQLGEQLAALDALIEGRQLRASRRAAADGDPAVAEALALAPRFARALHATIVGIDRLQQAVDTFETAVLALIRETLRVERDALGEAIGHAERRFRLARVKLAAQLDEAVFLLEAHAGLLKLERAGCTQQGVPAAHEAVKCRDEVAKTLLAYGNAWTLGRAAEKRADVIDLGVRHDASIGRSRAAMAMRQVYLAAGVAELVKFNKGGLPPEALAQIVVSAVGFGVVAAGVWAK